MTGTAEGNGRYTVKEILNLVVLPRIDRITSDVSALSQRVENIERIMVGESSARAQRQHAWRVGERTFGVFVGLAVIGSMAVSVASLLLR